MERPSKPRTNPPNALGASMSGSGRPAAAHRDAYPTPRSPAPRATNSPNALSEASSSSATKRTAPVRVPASSGPERDTRSQSVAFRPPPGMRGTPPEPPRVRAGYDRHPNDPVRP